MRKAGLLAFVAGIALLAFAASTPVYASDPHGFNGTVKIHEGATEHDPVMENDPHVCTFHIHGFNFDGASTGWWKIYAWPPTGDGSTVVDSGSWGPASASGEWRTGVKTLPDGHYKLAWDQTDPQAPGGEKHKVFWVDCNSNGTTTSGTTTSGTTTSGTTSGTTTAGTTTSGTTTSGTTTSGTTTSGTTTGGTTTAGTTSGTTTSGTTTSGTTTTGTTTSGTTTSGTTAGTTTTGTTSGTTTSGTTTSGTTTTGTTTSGTTGTTTTGGQGSVTSGSVTTTGTGTTTGGAQGATTGGATTGATEAASSGGNVAGAPSGVVNLPSTSTKRSDESGLIALGIGLMVGGAGLLTRRRHNAIR